MLAIPLHYSTAVVHDYCSRHKIFKFCGLHGNLENHESSHENFLPYSSPIVVAVGQIYCTFSMGWSLAILLFSNKRPANTKYLLCELCAV